MCLVRSPGTVYHWTFVRHVHIINVQKHAQDTSVLSFSLHWLFPEYEQRTLYGAFVVTLAMLLRLINCRFIIIIISISEQRTGSQKCALLYTQISHVQTWEIFLVLQRVRLIFKIAKKKMTKIEQNTVIWPSIMILRVGPQFILPNRTPDIKFFVNLALVVAPAGRSWVGLLSGIRDVRCKRTSLAAS